ncbi:MAG: DNA mismatch repair protein MutS [Candidatus Omnitrophota bacterium]
MRQMNKTPMLHIDRMSLYSDTDAAYISPAACHGLELNELINTIGRTSTPMGKRLFRNWIYHPLKDPKAVLERQSAVTIFKHHRPVWNSITEMLSRIPDIEKSISRISCGLTHARDMLSLRSAMNMVPELRKALSPLSEHNPLFTVRDMPDIRELLDRAINPDAPLSGWQGKIIRKGYSNELDSLRDAQENGREWLRQLQAREVKRTGINSLKIGFNNVFGYYIVVSKPNLHLVPPDYMRKQTLVNAERFITPELKNFEEKTLTADEKINAIEAGILSLLQKEILSRSGPLHETAGDLARVDALASLAGLAMSPGYIAPAIDDGFEISIRDGRHPVVEERALCPFIPNDTMLDCDDNHLLIITGPNMSGKSTFIRQTAVLVIMAQIGSYIPAKEARIGVVDKIFTRIGSRDDIAKGQSTFMVEMSETAGILNNLSSRSLVILDEIGRGTSTYDGLSLAWAIAEYLDRHKVRTLFATHFHELTALAGKNKGVKNYNVAVKEWKDEIIFLHKIVPGGCDDSYGIYVAKLAGIPREVISRGTGILTQLELSGSLEDKITSKSRGEKQLTLFGPAPGDPAGTDLNKIGDELKKTDLNALTPVEALNLLHRWQNVMNKNKKITEPT